MLALVYVLASVLPYGTTAVLWSDPAHCPAACTQCQEGPELCVVTPVLMQFSCPCLLHHALCNGFAQNAVFYAGKCDPHPYFHLEHMEMALYSFRGTDIVPLRLREHSHHKRTSTTPAPLADEDDKPQMRLMDLRGDNRRSISASNIKMTRPTVNNTELCSMFFKEDKKFQRAYKMKHFQCPNANPTMLQKVPLDESEKEEP